jgi:hypothetical protein
LTHHHAQEKQSTNLQVQVLLLLELLALAKFLLSAVAEQVAATSLQALAAAVAAVVDTSTRQTHFFLLEATQSQSAVEQQQLAICSQDAVNSQVAVAK